MKKILTKAKGWVTITSLTALIGDIIAVKSEIVPAFETAANQDVSLLGLAALVGAIFGIVRKFSKAYKES